MRHVRNLKRSFHEKISVVLKTYLVKNYDSERFFVKDTSNSLKIFTHFAERFQNNEKVFEDFMGISQKILRKNTILKNFSLTYEKQKQNKLMDRWNHGFMDGSKCGVSSVHYGYER